MKRIKHNFKIFFSLYNEKVLYKRSALFSRAKSLAVAWLIKEVLSSTSL